MRGMNRVLLIGRLGRDPETKQTEGGHKLTTFSVATSDAWNDQKTGERVERTEWHRIVSWDKRAELAAEYLAKGRQVCIEGRLQTRKWQDAEGKDRWSTEVVAESITFLDAPRAASGDEAVA
jgi:single-strand DNA-binding protein